MRSRCRPARTAVLVLLLASGSVLAGAVKVNINLPLPPRLDTSGVQTILVVHFLANDHPSILLSDEVVDLLRSTLRKRTGFRILDVDPPNIPEQNLEDLLRNREYWQEIGRRYGADLILSGEIFFESVDRSGFVQEDYVSPVTGQRLRRTRYAERESFDLSLDLVFIWGKSGEVAYKDVYDEEALYGERGADHLSVLHALVTKLEPDIIGILTPRWRSDVRYLLTD
jgi:hypothetical protein